MEKRTRPWACLHCFRVSRASPKTKNKLEMLSNLKCFDEALWQNNTRRLPFSVPMESSTEWRYISKPTWHWWDQIWNGWDWNVGSDLRARCAVCSPRTPLVQNLFFGFLSSVVANWESCSSISIGQGDKDWLAWTKKTQRTYLVCPHARPSIELLTSYKPTCCNWKQVFLLHTRFFLCVYLPELDLLVE